LNRVRAFRPRPSLCHANIFDKMVEARPEGRHPGIPELSRATRSGKVEPLAGSPSGGYRPSPMRREASQREGGTNLRLRPAPQASDPPPFRVWKQLEFRGQAASRVVAATASIISVDFPTTAARAQLQRPSLGL
jgi:hypothetical protein